jgi:hypothetical protein
MRSRITARFLVLLVTAGLLAGCASGASTSGMIANAPVVPNAASKYQDSMGISDVSGGEETNPLWMSKVGNSQFREALEQSLVNNRLRAASPAAARYLISAKLNSLSQPLAGLDMSVSATVHYTVTERATNQTIYAQSITSTYTAKFGDSLIGVERLKLANEGAMRENIKEFIKRIYALGS